MQKLKLSVAIFERINKKNALSLSKCSITIWETFFPEKLNISRFMERNFKNGTSDVPEIPQKLDISPLKASCQ